MSKAHLAPHSPRGGLAGFGKRVDIPERVPATYQSWEYLNHFNGSSSGGPVDRVGVQGTQTTKFHLGFQRRRQADIVNQDTAVLTNQHSKFEKSIKHHESRRARLHDIDHYNGFDILTGAPKARQGSSIPTPHTKPLHATSKPKDAGEGRESEMDQVARILLRDSHYRFFAPQTTGNNLIRRQQGTHYTEGLLKHKMTSVLGVGRNDLPSEGVEDQFQYADYGDVKYIPRPGMTTIEKQHHTTRVAKLSTSQMRRAHQAREAEIASVRDLK